MRPQLRSIHVLLLASVIRSGHTKRVLALLTLVMTALIARPQTKQVHAAPPECYYGEGHGMMGGEQYTCERGVLIHRSYWPLMRPESRNRIETFRPSPEAWSRFWESVNAAGVWKWQRYYSAKVYITDGDGWLIELHHEHRAVKSQGYNAFPRNFEEFASALERLKDDARKDPAPESPGDHGRTAAEPR